MTLQPKGNSGFDKKSYGYPNHLKYGVAQLRCLRGTTLSFDIASLNAYNHNFLFLEAEMARSQESLS